MSQSVIVDLAKPGTTPRSPPVKHRYRINRLTAAFIFTVLLGLYVFQLWLQITHTSATYDEPFHIVAGYRYWQCGDYGINPEHPPLLKLLAALPIRSQNVVEPAWPCGSKITPKGEGVLAGAQFLARNGFDRILIPTRLAASLMSLLLAALVFLAAREMFGQAEAFVDLGLLIFEPNLIAHGSLVTTDMALTATAFAAVYAFYRYRRKPGVSRLLLTGVAVGLMLASKHSGILMPPVLFLLLVADILLARRSKAGTDVRLGRNVLCNSAAYVMIFLIGLFVLWASYSFRYHVLPGATKDGVSVVDFFKPDQPDVAAVLSGRAGGAIEFIRRAHVFPESYVYGLADIVGWGKRETYLLGKVYPGGRWFYFPFAFTIKTSIALLLLLPLALLTRELYRKHPREMLFLLVPSVAYFAISLTSGINIGVRHILPVYPFFMTVAAAGACVLARQHRVFFFGLIALLLFHAGAAMRTAPSYIAFANDLWGGTNNTHRLLHDSNVDWGQNLKGVEAYLEKEGVRDCWLAYYGNGELARANKMCRLLPASGWTVTGQIVEPVPPVIEGTILLSTSVLPPHSREYEAVAKTEPVAILGGGIFVYRGRFEVPLAAALSHTGRVNQIVRLKGFDEAIADGRKAVGLAPDDPGARLRLGTALARAGKNEEARRELEAAVESSRSNLDLFRGMERQAQLELRRLR